MAIKQEKELTLTRLAIRDVMSKSNPLAESPEGGLAQNVISYRGRIVRMPYFPVFQNNNDTTRVWKLFEFKFFRNGAQESQLIIVRASGKIYTRAAGDEFEILPGASNFGALTAKPSIVSIANRMHVTDGTQYLIWNGWTWKRGGLVEPSAPTTSLAGGALTGTFDICVTAAYLENGTQIHESTHSPITTVSPAAQNITVNQPTLEANANYWNVYMSEIDGAGLRMRRVATVSKNTASTVISALPASTNPFAPIRNDPPQPNRLLFNWKNRLGQGDRTDGRNFWFTAFEEVAGNFNGAPEECVPGRSVGSTSSDLINSWTLPDKGESLTAGCWHENFAFLGTDRNGYVVQGEGGLLDNRALRDFYPLKIFSFGTCGPWGMISTPHGLVNFSPEHKLTLWEGGEDVTDLGEDIQADLDTINGDNLYETELLYWNGNGRDWLILCSPGLQKLYIYDFAAVITQPEGGQQRGAWFHYINTLGMIGRGDPSCVCVYHDGSQPILLLGTNSTANGQAADTDVAAVLQMDANCQPAHLGLSFILSTVYLGGTVLSACQSTIKTSEYSPTPERFIRAKYLVLSHRLERALSSSTGELTETQARSGTDPIIFIGTNQLGIGETSNPDLISTPTPKLLPDGSKRVWLPASNTSSAVGALCKRLFIEATWTITDSLNLDGSGRMIAHNNELLNFQLAWMPTDLLAQ